MWAMGVPATWIALAEATPRSAFAQKAGQGPRSYRYLCRRCDVEWHAPAEAAAECWLCGEVDRTYVWGYGTRPWAYETQEAAT